MAAGRKASSTSPLAVLGGLAFVLAVVAGLGLGVVAAATVGQRAGRPVASQAAINWPAAVPTGLARNTAVTPIAPAPSLDLTDQDGRPFELASLRGSQVLVFFGYTHCPDVCPTTLADVRDALARSATPFKVVFVTVDPDRDDPAALAQYMDYYQAGFIGLTGSASDIRLAADAWGIQYARIDNDSAAGYAMAHTADAFLVDAAGQLRHRIRFGAGPAVIVDRVAQLAGEPQPPATPPAATPPAATPGPAGTPVATPGPTAAAGVTPAPGTIPVKAVLQTTVIRVGMNRMVVNTSDPNNRELARPENRARVSFRSRADPSLPPIEVDAHQIWVNVGARGSWVVDAAFPAPGVWTATMTLSSAAGEIGRGEFPVTVKERGSTPAVGDPAPSIRTPKGSDWNGILANISTDTFPDPRFYEHSVDELLAARRAFVLILYSPAYCPTTACGPLLKNAKVIASEFPDVPFVHVEPYKMLNYGNRLIPDYSNAGLSFNEHAQAYGIPVDPFVFVIDAGGRVAASFELIIGNDELRAAIRAATQP